MLIQNKSSSSQEKLFIFFSLLTIFFSPKIFSLNNQNLKQANDPNFLYSNAHPMMHSKEENILRKKFYERNLLRHKETFTTITKIILTSCEIIEKHPQNEIDILQGAQFLKQMFDSMEDIQELKKILNKSNAYWIKVKNLYYSTGDENFSSQPTDKELLKEALTELFNAKAAHFLSEASDAKLYCSIKGGSANLAYFLSGNAGVHSLVCQSTLGRREHYLALDLSLGFGLGATVNISKDLFKNKEAQNKSLNDIYEIPISFYNPSTTKYFFSSGSIAALKGVSSQNRYTNSSKELTVGLGAHYSWGQGQILKIKDLTPDLRNFFAAFDRYINHEAIFPQDKTHSQTYP